MIKSEMYDQTNCPCMDVCPLQYTLSVLGGKWRVAILCVLRTNGPTRYNELKRKVGGITNTVLATSLRELEEAGLVVRKQYNEMPVRVEYSLTERGKSLIPILDGMCEWGQIHRVCGLPCFRSRRRG